MSNYYKTISVGSTEISTGRIDQKIGLFAVALNGVNVVEVRDNDAYINYNRILTTTDLLNTSTTIKVSFGSGIYLGSGTKYLRYCGNCDSGYDTELRVSNVYNTPFPITIKKISIQKGFVGDTTINIPAIGYSKQLTGNFLVDDVNIDVGVDEKLYIEIVGDPSLETTVELYVVETTNVLTSNTINLTTITQPTFNEVFTNHDGVTSTPFSISIV
jgi:hypothetical protein